MDERDKKVIQRTVARHRYNPLNLTLTLSKLPFMTIELLQQTLAELKSINAAEEEQELIVLKGSEVKREHLRFLWEPWLPLGKLVHFGGASNQGKSPVTMDLIARVTSGSQWPDKKPCTAQNVILMNIEDAFSDTILPRIDLAGGDSSRLFYIKGTKLTRKGVSADAVTALDRDMHLVADLAKNTPDLGLIIIDPVTNYVGKLNSDKDVEMRMILTPLAALADELKTTVITVGHLNRREKGTDPLSRMMGANAFVGVARAVYAFGPDPDSDSPYAHIMSPARGAIGDGSLKYHTESVTREWDGESSPVIRVVWDGKSKASAEDATDPTSRADKTLISEAAKALREFLKGGKKPAQECQNTLKAAGYDPDKVNVFKVRRKAGVATEQREKQHWWFLSTRDDLF